ncbi:MAG TPA: hypothetical protein VD731_03290 [Nitrosopumilaceae archaeon]|nr:hypothetical protein [Nitrosopumilaceae archaeon]
MNLIAFVLILVSLSVFNAYAESIPDYDNPYAPIFTDKEVYSWTDKIVITIVAPSWDADRHMIDEIGNDEGHFIKILSSEGKLEPYRLTETEPSSGIFTGEVILTGFAHDVNGDGKMDTNPRTSGNGPTNGMLETQRDGGITISFEFADGVVLTKSINVSWIIGEIRFLKSDHSIDDTAIIQVIDQDMNLNPEGIDQIEINISSDSDTAGISVVAIETTENSGIFEASISFSQTHTSSGNRLYAVPDDTLKAKYDDHTLPSPYSISEILEISAEAKFVSNIPPIERISITRSFIADSTGKVITAPTRNSQLQIAGTIHNNQNYEQNFMFIIQIKDSENSVVSLSWIEGEMAPDQDLEVAQSWSPTKAGNYTVETFVWTSLKEAIPLSPIQRQTYFIQ